MRANLSLTCALHACYDVIFPTLEAGKRSDFDLAYYARDMCNNTPFSCKRGGLLECNLFANVYKVNVAIHQDVDVRRRDGVYVHGTFPTIHLLYHDEHYQLLRYDWPWSQYELRRSKSFPVKIRKKLLSVTPVTSLGSIFFLIYSILLL